MSSESSWTSRQPEEDKIYQIWENDERELKVQEYEDGTWDTFLNETLKENYDTREEAVERAETIMSSD